MKRLIPLYILALSACALPKTDATKIPVSTGTVTRIDTLQGQLEVKDRQIEELNARLAEVSAALLAAQQTAAAAQALHAGTIQQQLLTGEAGADQKGQEPEQKRGWFSKLFRG